MVTVDPASPGVVRRRRKVKTDRTGARKMVRALRAWDGGDREAMSPVRVPTVAEEDAKRLLRRRERLVRERRRLANAIDGLLRLHGASCGNPAQAGFRARPDGLRTGYGTELPPELREEILGILGRLELVAAELRTVEARKAAALEASQVALAALPAPEAVPQAARACLPAAQAAPGGPAAAGDDAEGSAAPAAQAGGLEAPPGAVPAAEPAGGHRAALLVRLRGIGANDALLLDRQLLYRDFRNRRHLASMAGLAPVPWASGGADHDQGISRAGSTMLRKHLVQMAWRWLRHQPDSALSEWFRRYVSARDGRSRKRGIVALARRLLVALWRYATIGLVPQGAVLSPA